MYSATLTPRGQRALQILERLLVVVAVVGLGSYVWFHVDAAIHQRYYSRLLDKAGVEPSAAPALSSEEEPPSQSPEHTALGDPLGRVEIPRLGVSVVILEGIDDQTLLRAVGHIPGTAYPGRPGNVALAGHRDSFFRALRDIRRRDIIKLETPRGVSQYIVDSISVVAPEQTEVLEPTHSSQLTLVTCYPFYHVGPAPKRFIVEARLAGPRRPGAAQTVASPGELPKPGPFQRPDGPVARTHNIDRMTFHAGSWVVEPAEQTGKTAEKTKGKASFLRPLTYPFRKLLGLRKRDSKDLRRSEQ